jgi:hypothetical protein
MRRIVTSWTAQGSRLMINQDNLQSDGRESPRETPVTLALWVLLLCLLIALLTLFDWR